MASKDEVTDKTIVDAAGNQNCFGGWWIFTVTVHLNILISDADPEGLGIILKYEKESRVTSYCPS